MRMLETPAKPSLHDFGATEGWRRRYKVDRQIVRRLRTAFYKKQRSADLSLAELPSTLRADFAEEFDFHALELDSRHDSSRDGATKLIFRTRQGLLLESVVLRMTSGRTALCVSTQVGCAANCDFCATGKMGIARNLLSDEILDQCIQAAALLAAEGRRLRNVVFMGMGEPFHNEKHLHTALSCLTDSRTFDFHPRRLLVSTVGIPDAMVRCASRWPGVRLALSLHSAREDVRMRLMPVSQRHGLAGLRSALEEVTSIQQQAVMIEYLLLAGITDQEQDIEALIEYLRGIPVHVNLLSYNPIAKVPHLVASSTARREEFAQSLRAAGFPVTMRYSLGADIEAACGQLVLQGHRPVHATT